MKKSCMVFLALCGAFAFLVPPGMAIAADVPADVPMTGWQDLSVLSSFLIANPVNIINFSNVLKVQETPPTTDYTPTSGQPGYVSDDPPNFDSTHQNTYQITLPPHASQIGGYFPTIPGFDPTNGAVNGVLVVAENLGSLTLPSGATGPGSWSDPTELSTFLPQVDAIIVFESVTGSTAFPFDHLSQVPEPGVLPLLGSGLIGLVGLRRKFRE